MPKSNFNDPGNNDLSSSFPPYDFGSPSESEAHSDRPRPGVGGQDDNQCTPEGRRAGYGHQYLGPNNHALSQPKPNGHAGDAAANRTTPSQGGRAAMGGHNMDERGQYTVRMPRGSSL